MICTFVNEKRGSITIVEDTRPDDPQDFSYTATGGLSPNSFQLDDDGDNSNALSNTRTYANVPPGRLRHQSSGGARLAGRGKQLLGWVAGFEHRAVRGREHHLHVRQLA